MYRAIIKPTLDFLLSFLMIILLSPVYLFLTVIGFFAMKGNPFYVQKRPGKNGKIFHLIKFRSMTNAKNKKGDLLDDSQRVTKYGRFLRSTSLDELPELFDILCGKMSFVGPRPLVIEYLPYYNEIEKHRHDVRPGLTGLAQINGRNNLQWEERFNYDVDYVNNISFAMDVKIFMKTVVKVFKREDVVVQGEGFTIDFDKYRQQQISKKENSMEKLLMMGTGLASVEIIKYAKSQGIYTIVTDYDTPEKSFAKKVSDEYWMINTKDVDLLEKKCREERVTAVICGVSEFNLEMTMELCKRLGLPSYCTPESWYYSRDKSAFKSVCKRVGAPVPEDYYVDDNLSDEQLERIVYPVVVKPIDMSGNRGISYCNNKNELIAAYKYARSVSKNPKIIVERMLKGKEWYSYYAIADGEIRQISLNAMEAQPGQLKNLYSLTTTITDNVERFNNEINPQIENVLKEIGCKEGIAWVQVMLDEDNHFYIIEMGYRLPGDMPFINYPDLCGFDSVKWLTDYSRGIKHSKEDLPSKQLHSYQKCSCGYSLWTSKGGVISSFDGFDKIEQMDGISFHTLHYVGERFVEHRPLGVVCISANTIDDFIAKLKIVNETISIRDEDNEDVIIKYTDYDYLRKVYDIGLKTGGLDVK